MSSSTEESPADNLETEIRTALENYPDEIKKDMQSYMAKLGTDCKKLAERVIPGGVLPIYVAPVNSENLADKSRITTWEQYNHLGKYGQFADNYCRPNEIGEYQYPVRNTNGTIELASCDKLVTSELKQLTNLTSQIGNLILLAKSKLIRLDTQSSDGTELIKNRVEAKIKEYERLQQQYLQLSRMLQNNTELIDRRQQSLSREQTQLDTAENQFNIERDVFNDFIHVENNIQKRNQSLILGAKVLLFVLWLIVVILALYIDVGFNI
jgi:hypothetical protein